MPVKETCNKGFLGEPIHNPQGTSCLGQINTYGTQKSEITYIRHIGFYLYTVRKACSKFRKQSVN